MGTVYLAIQESLERPVVLKCMSPEESSSSDSVERFLNEGRIIAALRHPNIITIYDIGTVENIWYISMEYVEGGDLKQKLEHPVTVPQTLDLLVRIGSALDLAHQDGVVHRDVKTANILYRTDGTPLLTDFGIAKYAKSDTELTSTGTILGSPFYMSPEQAEGSDVDGRTDIYSLGVIFFEMLAGRRPYVGDSAIKIIMRHLQAPIPKLPEEHARFQPLLEKMLAKDRKDRFADAADLVDAVVEIQTQEALAKKKSLAGDVAVSHGDVASTGPIEVPRPTGGGKRAIAEVLGGLVLVAIGFMSFFFYSQSLRHPTVAVSVVDQPAARSPGSPAKPGQIPATDNPAVQAQASVDHLGNPVGLDVNRVIDSNNGETDQVKTALAWLGADALRKDKLTTPAGDNAYYYFSRLWQMDPGNAAAQRGMDRIAERFIVLAEKHFSQKNYQQARAYIRLGLAVEPENEGLLQLRQFIDQEEKSTLGNLLDIFFSTS